MTLMGSFESVLQPSVASSVLRRSASHIGTPDTPGGLKPSLDRSNAMGGQGALEASGSYRPSIREFVWNCLLTSLANVDFDLEVSSPTTESINESDNGTCEIGPGESMSRIPNTFDGYLAFICRAISYAKTPPKDQPWYVG